RQRRALGDLRLPRDGRGLPRRGGCRGRPPPPRDLGRVRVVAVPERSWRPDAAPAPFPAPGALAGGGPPALWPPPPPTPGPPHRRSTPVHQHQVDKRPPARFYRVRAGDTLAAIARRTHTPLARLQRLNPAVQPTALFIGQRLRLR